MKGIKKLLVLALYILLSASTYFPNKSESIIKVKGNTNFHPWEMETRIIHGHLKWDKKEDKLAGITALTLNIPARSLKSGKKKMEKTAHEKLKAATHPDIIFELKDIQTIKRHNDRFHIKARGDLQIAGIQREVEINAQIHSTKGKVKITGEHHIHLTDYMIRPPTTAFGIIRAEEEVRVEFDIVFNKSAKLLKSGNNSFSRTL